MRGPLSAWPWERLGSFKYILYAPLIAKILYSSRYCEESMVNIWSHIFIICMLRCLIYQLWSSYSNMLFLNRKKQISRQGVDFEQIDKEWDWDNFIILQAITSSMVCYLYQYYLGTLPIWNKNGIVAITLLHAAVSEPLYYWTHKAFHGKYLFSHYHSFHHSSAVLQPFTAGHATFVEQLILTAVIGIPIVGCCLVGHGSIGIIYGYVLTFDMLRCLGHCNVEIVPYKMFEFLPFLRYIIYTPTYHSLHHKTRGSNFCLFMPLFDVLGNTLDKNSWQMHKKTCLDSGKIEWIPNFVFLAHLVDFSSSMHAPFIFRSYSSMPYSTRIFMLPLWPVSFISTLLMWALSKSFLVSFFNLRGSLHQTWAVPRFGLLYFLPFCAQGINHKIEEAILTADRLGVKVISLAALNKNEALNGGGALFVKKHPNLKVRVVHGNTLTAGVTLNEIPKDVTQVFLTGSTSKLGRAIALYLCRRGVTVLMLTASTERFNNIKKEAHPDCQKYLIQVTKYQAANKCKTWIIGKWMTKGEQKYAAPGTHFHQFVVPPISPIRSDCTYGDLAAMRLPRDVEGLGCCEYTHERGVVGACHAGGIVHALQGWENHEVGAIDVDKIDQVWEASLKLGFKPL